MFGRSCHLSCTNANVAWCLVPGSSTRRSRRTWLGQSRRNAAMELARFPTLGLSPSTPPPTQKKKNPPATPAGILSLQQEVAVVPPLAAELDGVVPLQLGEGRGDVPRLLRAIPRQAAG